jgi:hypothetical protein
MFVAESHRMPTFVVLFYLSPTCCRNLFVGQQKCHG